MGLPDQTAFDDSTLAEAVRHLQQLLNAAGIPDEPALSVNPSYAVYIYPDFAWIFNDKGALTYSIAAYKGYTAIAYMHDPLWEERKKELEHLANGLKFT